MTAIAEGESVFAPERFFALAAARLDPEPPLADAVPGGEHVLNPGFVAEGYRDAAVLMPVIARHPDVTMLLTQRTPHLSSHAGQIAFPGGKIDATDEGPAAAAIREANEEIGLDPAKVATIGYLAPYLTRTGYRIIPVLGRVEPDHRLVLNAHEVDDVFEVPLAFLMSPANHFRKTRELLGAPRFVYEMPFEGRYIWGITAGIIRGLYERIFG